MASQLEQLSGFTTIVADTGEIEAIKEYKPTDATTNPSLLLAASQMEQYRPLVDDAIAFGKASGKEGQELLDLVIDKMAVNFGTEILKIVPGYVSTEVDARLSFDVEGNIARARRIIDLYESFGIPRSRVLIKLASTWEGVRAAEQLQKEGINCNMTLLFCFAQAVACAEAGAHLISPFVGRIRDWYLKAWGKADIPAPEDPGVLSVARIYNYYKTHGYPTIVMGASFRTVGEILELAGCDRLTISPKLLQELRDTASPVERKLSPETAAAACGDAKMTLTESEFRFALNEDAMATEKLAEGIRKFSEDIRNLEDAIRERL